MRNEYYDEHEQAEAVKQWIKDNGLSIFAGIALGMGALFGWRSWQSSLEAGRVEAAQGYEQLVSRLDQGEEATFDVVNGFLAEYDNAAFATLAALKAAQLAVEARNLDEASRLLTYAAEQGEPPQVRQVAGLRLARVQLQTGQLDLAAATVDQHDGPGFEGIAAEIRGDILLAQGDAQGAREAYQAALDNGAGDRGLLDMKLNDLAMLEPEPAAAMDPMAEGESSVEAPEETTQDETSQDKGGQGDPDTDSGDLAPAAEDADQPPQESGEEEPDTDGEGGS